MPRDKDEEASGRLQPSDIILELKRDELCRILKSSADKLRIIVVSTLNWAGIWRDLGLVYGSSQLNYVQTDSLYDHGHFQAYIGLLFPEKPVKNAPVCLL